MRDDRAAVLRDIHERTRAIADRGSCTNATDRGTDTRAIAPTSRRDEDSARLLSAVSLDSCPFGCWPTHPTRQGVQALSDILGLSCGVSARRAPKHETRPLRFTPSSGNLQAVGVHVLLPSPLGGIHAGVYRYDHVAHALSPRRPFASPSCVPVVLVGLTIVTNAHAHRYGPRGFRYALLDVGHVIAALRFAAASVGWHARVLEVADETIGRLLQLPRTGAGGEPMELPVALVALSPRPDGHATDGLMEALDVEPRCAAAVPDTSVVHGSHTAHADPDLAFVITAHAKTSLAARSTDWKSWEHEDSPRLPSAQALANHAASRPRADRVFASRRSAQHFETDVGVTQNQFRELVHSLLGSANRVPFDVLPWPKITRTLLWVHQAEGMESGTYEVTELEDGFQRRTCGDLREDCWYLTCCQDLAEQAAFNVSFHCDPETLAGVAGGYRRALWESAVRCHSLYLAAESVGGNLGVSAIGAFFDEEVQRHPAARGMPATLYWAAVGIRPPYH